MALNLTETQKRIVDFRQGAILVKAGPGSGKTRVLAERIKALLKENRRTKILALTFSNMAADEMKERILEDDEIADAAENVVVGTIHSFALDLVQQRGTLIGLPENLTLFENESDRKHMLREIFTNDVELKRVLSNQDKPDKYLSDCLGIISDLKKKFISSDSYDENESIKYLYGEYNKFLLSQSAMDFDDILFFAYRILVEVPEVQQLYASLYKYVFVDESQDLNFAQYELIKALCGNTIKNIMLVGDSNQSIYGFNGSNSDIMTKIFVKDFQPVIIEMYENFRSAKRIVEFANKLENTESVSNYYYEGELKAYRCKDESAEALKVAAMIEELIKNGHPDVEKTLEYDDFAIIARNRYAFGELENIFDSKSIPYYFKKTAEGIETESEFMQVYDLVLRISSNPSDIIHMRELYNLLGKNYESSQHISVEDLLIDSKYHSICEALMWIGDDCFDIKKSLMVLQDEVEHNLMYSDDEKYLILSDIALWMRHWMKYRGVVPAENRSLLSFRNCVALGKTQDSSKNKGISLLSAHMSKGLQFEVVFVIGLCEGTFPDYRAVNKGGKELEQEKNNMFVAVTRAKRLCYLLYPQNKKMPWGTSKWQKESRFLQNIVIENGNEVDEV